VNRKNTLPIPEAIVQLQRQLDQLRSTQPRRTKLPESLWQAAVELGRQYGIYPVAHPLRLPTLPFTAGRISMQTFVPELRITSCACATTAPDESLTVPVIARVNDCAQAVRARIHNIQSPVRLLYIHDLQSSRISLLACRLPIDYISNSSFIDLYTFFV
jgi:hypothetical protein